MAFLGINQFHRVGLRFVCWFYDGNTQRLTESGFMENPGIEPATPGLQDIYVYPLHHAQGYCLWTCGFMVLWFYVQEHPKAQPAVVLILKRLRRRGHSLKSRPTDWERPGIGTETPGLQDRFIPYTTAACAKIQTVSFDLMI